jgi:uncharacterized protein (TIGR03032 family)
LSDRSYDISVSRHFPAWMAEVGASLCFTTYEAGAVLLAGLREDGKLQFTARMVARAMGIAAAPERLWIGTMLQVWRFEDMLHGRRTSGGEDRIYAPRVGHITGDIDCHDLGIDRDGRPVFVNTLYSCLARTSDRYSFEPLWRPPFISRLAAEDRCHLNGLAMADGEAAYVTCVARSDIAGGWRDFRGDGGLVIDVRSNEVVCQGLSMPHSPRLHNGRLWVLNSGSGEFGHVDLERGVFEPVAFLPGYLRGLALIGDYAVVGLSMARENRDFSGLALDENLRQRGAVARCALQVIDLRSGDIVHELRMQGELRELYDVAVIPGVRLPGMIGFVGDEIRREITFPAPPA